MRGEWEDAVVGLGSNLGDRTRALGEAIRMLAAISGIRMRRLSSVYRTSPVGFRRQPWFHNAAVAVRTRLAPRALLGRMRRIERAMGRRRMFPGGPRNIDLDLLLYGTRVERSPGLMLPHPRMHERRFALVTCAEAASGAIHPVWEAPVDALLVRLEGGEKVMRLPVAVQHRFRRLAGVRVHG